MAINWTAPITDESHIVREGEPIQKHLTIDGRIALIWAVVLCGGSVIGGIAAAVNFLCTVVKHV